MCSHIDEVNNNDKPLDHSRKEKIIKLNKYGLYANLVLVLSCAVVSAFRTTEHLEIHLLAAGPLFLALIISAHIQTWISLQLVPNVVTLTNARFRLFVLIIQYVLTVVGTIAAVIAFTQVKVPFSQIRSSGPHWDESWGGYHAHAVSSIAENIGIWMSCPFFASYVVEFKRIQTNNGKLQYKFIN